VYQLKGKKSPIGNTVADGAYDTLVAAMRADRAPNFFFLHYDASTWCVRNLLVVPHFAFPVSAVIRRNPLSGTARRAGWVGCNLALNRIPVEARIPVVADHRPVAPDQVRARFRRLQPIRDLSVETRGWTLDVLTHLRQRFQPVAGSGPVEFTNEQAYELVPQLAALHPGNRHVKEKIRQQLQVLRDLGLIRHAGRGRWGI
jgi:type II restriction enzyme